MSETSKPCKCGICQECSWARSHPDDNPAMNTDPKPGTNALAELEVWLADEGAKYQKWVRPAYRNEVDLMERNTDGLHVRLHTGDGRYASGFGPTLADAILAALKEARK